MGIVLAGNQYGKAQTRVVRVSRDGDRHRIKDFNVTVMLAGDLAESHLTGDNAKVLPTDSQKNTVYAFAGEHGIDQVEEFGLRLARHFVASQPAIHRARVSIEEYRWARLGPHSFRRDGDEIRTATITVDGDGEWVVSGLTGLVLLNSTGSEFVGFAKDRYTTLPEATDRILATAVDARWRHATAEGDWAASHAGVREALVAGFVETYSRSLQQTLYAMGRRALAEHPELVEVRLSLPNRHHLPVDLTPFGDAREPDRDRSGVVPDAPEVFVATDRPYGLIEGTVTRDDAPPPGAAWGPAAG